MISLQVDIDPTLNEPDSIEAARTAIEAALCAWPGYTFKEFAPHTRLHVWTLVLELEPDYTMDEGL